MNPGIDDKPKKKNKKKLSNTMSEESATLSGSYGDHGGSITLDKDRMVTQFNIKVGPYSFKLKDDGTCEVSAEWVTAAGNVNTGQVALSGDYSLHDFLKEHGPKGEDGKPEEWIEECPDVKVSWEVGVQLGPHQSDIMRVIAGTPGLWELRSRDEFVKLAWASLDPDEQGFLQALGFDQHKWDFKLLPESTNKPWSQLRSDEKYATLRLPVPAADPYWKAFWDELKKTGPVGELVVNLIRSGSPAPNEPLRALLEGTTARYKATSDAQGKVTLQGLVGGKYRLSTNAEGTNEGKAIRAIVEVKRGETVELSLAVDQAPVSEAG